MRTEGWDQMIDAQLQTRILAPHSEHDPLMTFPVAPKRFVDGVGHFSLSLHCDTWWQDLGHKLEIIEWIPVTIEHQRFDLTGEEPDQT